MVSLMDQQKRARLSPISGRLPLAILTTAFVGLFAAAVLSIGHVLKLPVPCGSSQGCIAVALHPSSQLMGIPIAYGGVAAYVLMITVARFAPTERWAQIAGVGLASIGTLVSAYLLYYSHAIIGATCRWCIASGVAMGLLLLLSIFLLKMRHASPVRPAIFWGLAAVTSLAVGVQAGLIEAGASKPPVGAERLRHFSAETLIDPYKSLGPAGAPVTIIMFGDMWCPGCRAVHAPLVEYQSQHPAGVRLVFRHFPLHRIRGHEFSGTIAALSEIAAETGQFWSFVELVYQQHGPLTGNMYLHLLSRLGTNVDEVEARLKNADEPAYGRVLRDMELAEEIGINSTPTFIVLLADHEPISANQRTLGRLLNSPQAQSMLARAASGGTGATREGAPD
jgi:uncharacterized membrane protein